MGTAGLPAAGLQVADRPAAAAAAVPVGGAGGCAGCGRAVEVLAAPSHRGCSRHTGVKRSLRALLPCALGAPRWRLGPPPVTVLLSLPLGHGMPPRPRPAEVGKASPGAAAALAAAALQQRLLLSLRALEWPCFGRPTCPTRWAMPQPGPPARHTAWHEMASQYAQRRTSTADDDGAAGLTSCRSRLEARARRFCAQGAG